MKDAYFVEFSIFICLAKAEAKQMIYQVKQLNQILVELHRLRNTCIIYLDHWVFQYSLKCCTSPVSPWSQLCFLPCGLGNQESNFAGERRRYTEARRQEILTEDILDLPCIPPRGGSWNNSDPHNKFLVYLS